MTHLSGKVARNKCIEMERPPCEILTSSFGARTRGSRSRVMPAKLKKLNASDSTTTQVPDFNQDALRSLTEKIEDNLKSQGRGAISKDAPAKPKTTTPKVKKKNGGNTTKTPVSISAVNISSNDTTAMGKQKPAVALRTTQGKKRLRDGRVKEERNRTIGDDVNTIKLGSRNTKIVSNENTDIDEEMVALGGTKEDVDLIADVMSDSEMEGEAAGPPEKLADGFEKEILQMVRQLGVDRVGMRELMADPESEEANRMKDLEENRKYDTASSNEVSTGVKPALKTATSVDKGQRSLVSKQQYPSFSPSDIHADFGLHTDF